MNRGLINTGENTPSWRDKLLHCGRDEKGRANKRKERVAGRKD
jgi:hypothetical protein